LPRPKKCRFIAVNPEIKLFKPAGIPTSRLEKIILNFDEFEALRLADYEALSHQDGAEKMGISIATFGRIVESGRKKLIESLVFGKAIIIEAGDFCNSEFVKIKNSRKCNKCGRLGFIQNL